MKRAARGLANKAVAKLQDLVPGHLVRPPVVDVAAYPETGTVLVQILVEVVPLVPFPHEPEVKRADAGPD